MTAPRFGIPPAGAQLRPRRAAYAVIGDRAGRVAVVRVVLGDGVRHWLPGGGLEPGETPEDAIRREVREELGRGVRLGDRIGDAIQYFPSADPALWFEMAAAFVRAEFDDAGATATGEHELHWLDPRREAAGFFHASHAWAARLA